MRNPFLLGNWDQFGTALPLISQVCTSSNIENTMETIWIQSLIYILVLMISSFSKYDDLEIRKQHISQDCVIGNGYQKNSKM